MPIKTLSLETLFIRTLPTSRLPGLRLATAAANVSATLVFATLVFATLALAALAPSPAAAEEINRIVLRVNDEILTLHDYEARKAEEISTILASQRLDQAQRQEQLEQVGKMVMQSMFSEMLLLSFADQQSIRITDADVNESVSQLMERQGIENRAQLREALARSGMTMEQLQDNARRELLWQQVVGRHVQSKVEIGEEELRAYYRNHQDEFRIPEKRWLKEVIVLEASGLESAELRRVAGEIHDALVAGGELEEVVEPYRENGTTTGVVDLEWLRAEELEASLSEAAWALSPGEYSQPIEARGGYHILLVEDMREAGMKSLSEVQEIIMRREYGARFNRELRIFLADLEEESYIHESLPPEAVGYQALSSDFEPEDELELFRAPILDLEAADGVDEAPEAEGTSTSGTR